MEVSKYKKIWNYAQRAVIRLFNCAWFFHKIERCGFFNEKGKPMCGVGFRCTKCGYQEK